MPIAALRKSPVPMVKSFGLQDNQIIHMLMVSHTMPRSHTEDLMDDDHMEDHSAIVIKGLT